ncbi:MAG: sulfatase-like hydrolase/transferase, partial [Spirochaetales bacterium]|nr:sulfatase-like hydrolase/transferase [Spirochaetales bacterium]
AEQGYRQIFLIGSNAMFGGRRLYLDNHGGYEFRDLLWAWQTKHIPAGYYVWWGYEDRKLFEFGKETLLELAEGDEPFNLTMLTVDTHMTQGYVCDLCGDEFDDRYSNVYACSDKQVTEFVEWIQQQDFYENTTIVIVGDHPTMDATYCRNVDPSYVRRVYTCIINAPVTPVRNAYRSYSTLDMLPTTLTALGVEIPGGRLGLGTSLYTNQRTLTEELGYTELSSSLSRYSSYLNELGSIVPVDESGNEISIGEDGSITVTSPDGNQVIMMPDGTQIVITPEGMQTIIAPDGTQTVLQTPGTAVP